MAEHRVVAHVTRTEEGGLVAHVPSFPDLVVRAPTLAELERAALDALAERVDLLQRAHEPVVAVTGIDWLER
jgi:predicted RNase H-like HicB family nuclease